MKHLFFIGGVLLSMWFVHISADNYAHIVAFLAIVYLLGFIHMDLSEKLDKIDQNII